MGSRIMKVSGMIALFTVGSASTMMLVKAARLCLYLVAVSSSPYRLAAAAFSFALMLMLIITVAFGISMMVGILLYHLLNVGFLYFPCFKILCCLGFTRVSGIRIYL
ncbi:MAG: hypothetical protein QW794_00270 [Thermosphaera sp.]